MIGGASSDEATRAVFGVTLLNQARFLPHTLESLASQTLPTFAAVLHDDCSSDRTPEIARARAEQDSRFHYYRSERRRGLTGSWREVFRLARVLHPEAPYFAWASDHDLWHSDWLARMVEALDGAPSAVLAYPQVVRIDEAGEETKGPWGFDTQGEASKLVRMRAAHRGGSKGDMVYGLFRADALERCGVLCDELLADRLLISEIALYGEFVQVPEVLWSRRFRKQVNLGSQRRTLFPDRPPLRSYVPWPLAHTAAIARHLVLEGRGKPQVGRLEGARAAATYLWLGTATALESRVRRFRLWVLRTIRRLR